MGRQSNSAPSSWKLSGSFVRRICSILTLGTSTSAATREIEDVISYLEDARLRSSPTQKSFNFKDPHSCRHCESIHVEYELFRHNNYSRECPGWRDADPRNPGLNCRCPPLADSQAQNGMSLAVKMDCNVLEAVSAAKSGCELYRWVIVQIAGYANRQPKDVLGGITRKGSFRMSGKLAPPPNISGGLGLLIGHKGFVKGESYGWLEGWTTAADPASRFITSRPYEHDVKSAVSVEFALSCFRTCVETHAKCRQEHQHDRDRNSATDLDGETISVTDIPTRLIDVRPASSPDRVALVLTDVKLADIRIAGFVTLSYCWGGEQPFALRRDTHQALSNGTRLSQLPQTLQDAVWVSRALGFKYLWIDSLCIFQDNYNDKEREISRMASYYRAAQLTICAAAAPSCADGFLAERPTFPFQTGPIRLPLRSSAGRDGGHIYLLNEMNEQDGVEPTATRGWTLQESMLSRRILIFARKQLYWTCCRYFASCGGKTTAPIHQDQDEAGRRSLIPSIAPVGTLDHHHPRYIWGKVVEEFTRRSLSFGRDKLPAISALAQYVATFNQSRGQKPLYIAGLLIDQNTPSSWIDQLVWYTTAPDCGRASSYRAPSWSWASLDGPVETERNISTHFNEAGRLATVEDCHIDLSLLSAPYGSVTGAHLIMTAKMCCLAGLKRRLPSCDFRWRWDPSETPQDRKEVMSALEAKQEGGSLMVVGMYCNVSTHYSETELRGILVDVSGTETGTYVRRGCFRLDAKLKRDSGVVMAAFQAMGSQTIKLV
jgi:hypothetical protein